MSLSAISNTLRAAIFQRDHGRCRYCHLLQFGQGAVFHINHVIPRCLGGPTVVENLVLQCPWCSLHKSNKIAGIDPVTGESGPIFHPLLMEWEDHFAMRVDGSIEARTTVGRATIEALSMNHSLLQTARLLQRATGIVVQ